MQSGDNFPLLDSIADKLGAAVELQITAVDAGLFQTASSWTNR